MVFACAYLVCGRKDLGKDSSLSRRVATRSSVRLSHDAKRARYTACQAYHYFSSNIIEHGTSITLPAHATTCHDRFHYPGPTPNRLSNTSEQLEYQSKLAPHTSSFKITSISCAHIVVNSSTPSLPFSLISLPIRRHFGGSII